MTVLREMSVPRSRPPAPGALSSYKARASVWLEGRYHLPDESWANGDLEHLVCGLPGREAS
eukprot:80163-Prymnesium_polylepis.1